MIFTQTKRVCQLELKCSYFFHDLVMSVADQTPQSEINTFQNSVNALEQNTTWSELESF